MIYDEIIQEAETKFGAGGNKYKFKEGDNRLRVLDAVKPYQSTYKGDKRVNYLHYIIDRVDNKIKLVWFPYTVVQAIGAYEKDPEYAFSELPMPYDINVVKVKTGPEVTNVKYSVVAARQNSPLTDSEKEEFLKMKPLAQVREEFKAREEAQPIESEKDRLLTELDVRKDESIFPETNTEEISIDEIPF